MFGKTNCIGEHFNRIRLRQILDAIETAQRNETINENIGFPFKLFAQLTDIAR